MFDWLLSTHIKLSNRLTKGGTEKTIVEDFFANFKDGSSLEHIQFSVWAPFLDYDPSQSKFFLTWNNAL